MTDDQLLNLMFHEFMHVDELDKNQRNHDGKRSLIDPVVLDELSNPHKKFDSWSTLQDKLDTAREECGECTVRQIKKKEAAERERAKKATEREGR